MRQLNGGDGVCVPTDTISFVVVWPLNNPSTLEWDWWTAWSICAGAGDLTWLMKTILSASSRCIFEPWKTREAPCTPDWTDFTDEVRLVVDFEVHEVGGNTFSEGSTVARETFAWNINVHFCVLAALRLYFEINNRRKIHGLFWLIITSTMEKQHCTNRHTRTWRI